MNGIADLLAGSGLNVRREEERQLPDGSRALYLHAGQTHASAAPMQLTTILGSCVSICLWDPGTGIGGMNHYMLPDDVGSNTATPRYANFAIRHLFEQLVLLGVRRSRLQAKLFGGASVMSSQAGPSLGMMNVEVGRLRLRQAGIPLVDEDSGGSQGRKIVFSTSTGVVVVKKV